jgi:Antitoxin VbhA
MDDLKAKGADERRGHVATAIADSRIEGFPPPSRPEERIHDAYVCGDIDADGLMAAITLMVRQQQLQL